jgi:repressor LexA
MISKYEKGVHVPGFTFVDYCAYFFNVTTDYLMGRNEQIIAKKIPVLGTIAAGVPITAIENIIGYEIDNDLRNGNVLFFIDDKLVGESY